nr:DNA-directed RNA polymerase I subunit 1 [Tanacetum cinerariifolium]
MKILEAMTRLTEDEDSGSDDTPNLKVPNGEFIIVAVNVDDLFVTGASFDLINEFKKRMSSQFEMSNLGELTYYLRIKISQEKDCVEIKQERSNEDLKRSCRYMPSPRESHARAIKQILCYLKGTSCITWCSQKQTTVALFSCEAEFMSATIAACQANWPRELLAEVTRNEHVIVEHVSGENQRADLLTNALARIRYKEMRSLLGVQELPSSTQKFRGDCWRIFDIWIWLMRVARYPEVIVGVHVQLVQKEDASSDVENGGDEGKVVAETGTDDEMDAEHPAEKQPAREEDAEKVEANVIEEFVARKFDRSTFVEVKDLNLEVHFRFTNEPEVLLAEVVQKVAKKVYIKGSGKLDQCQPVKYSVIVKQVYWNQNHPELNKTKEKMKNSEKKTEDGCLPCALQASGVELPAFWDMEDDLDVNHVYSNNVHSFILCSNTYGVEAARTSLILEMKNVFGSYGVEIDDRHFSLIADHMTHSGGYRRMSRFGSISESVMSDNLETPMARICLGLPVKVGTGSMDLMQKLNL